jgi:hypothetical protein
MKKRKESGARSWKFEMGSNRARVFRRTVLADGVQTTRKTPCGSAFLSSFCGYLRIFTLIQKKFTAKDQNVGGITDSGAPSFAKASARQGKNQTKSNQIKPLFLFFCQRDAPK